MTFILGLNAFHGDSSACLVIDGQLICAIEEERLRRIKHWAGLPTKAIKWCLNYGNVDIKDLDYVAIARDPSAHIYKKLLRVLTKTPSIGFLKNRLHNVAKIADVKESIASIFGLDLSSLKFKVRNVEHHRAHIGSSFLISPFEEAACLSVDGFGDFVSTMRGKGIGNRVDITDWVEFPHSLGIFYTAFTQYLGFWKYGDEYKIMGLSALGDPVYKDLMKQVVRCKDNGLFELDTSYFLHDKEGVDMVWNNSEPLVDGLFSQKMIDLFGKQRGREEELKEKHEDMAASVQAMYEEAFFHMLNDTYKRYKTDKLVLSGGCIQNSLANGKIFENTFFKEVYIQPASYDAGTAIGAAFWLWNVILGKKRNFVMESPYWGPGFTDTELDEMLERKEINYEKLDEATLCKRVATDIANGKIVGWFQGRTEWGPRALGNRSILVDPRRKEMKDILNQRIKRREGFRPFAPSIMEEYTSEWFDGSYPVPFMEKVYKIKQGKRDLIPAVTHVDGTGRLQTVAERMNPQYYGLIQEFFKATGVPLVLNTSFNENEPIVNTPENALDCFLRTKMDVLAMGCFYIVQ